jgi:flagellar biosynthesis protein FliP
MRIERRRRTWARGCAAAGLALVAADAVAQTASLVPGLTITVDPAVGGSSGIADALKIVLALTAVALAPALLIAMTSFTRTIIVLSLLRQAFGMQDTPPNTVLVSMALFLTLFTMTPVLTAAYRDGVQPLLEERASIEAASAAGIAPFRDFMIRQTRDSDLALILDVAGAPIPDSVDELQTVHVVPAFLLSELKTAFQIGFVIFLPFLLVDLVVASILMSMGMLMVPPTIISLPLKIMMFVLIDGWALSVRAVLGSFA